MEKLLFMRKIKPNSEILIFLVLSTWFNQQIKLTMIKAYLHIKLQSPIFRSRVLWTEEEEDNEHFILWFNFPEKRSFSMSD
jgi:hypothetical protein